jgi:hypothetical protein
MTAHLSMFSPKEPMRFKIRISVLALALAACAFVPRLAAQTGPFDPPRGSDDRIVVTLVLVGGGNEPTLLRRPGGQARNVILLDSVRVNAQQLSDAVFQLLILEAQDPAGQRRAPNSAHRVRTDVPHPVYPWAEEALQRLRASSGQSIPGVTTGRQQRTIQIWLRPLRGVAR